MSLMRIRAADESDLAVMQDIERAAGGWFREIGMPEIAEDEPLSLGRGERAAAGPSLTLSESCCGDLSCGRRSWRGA